MPKKTKDIINDLELTIHEYSIRLSRLEEYNELLDARLQIFEKFFTSIEKITTDKEELE